LQDLEAQKASGKSQDADEADEAGVGLGSNEATAEPEQAATAAPGTRITFDQHVKKPRENSTLYIPSPRERDDGTKLPLRADPG
jgi:hypothetical protein